MQVSESAIQSPQYSSSSLASSCLASSSGRTRVRAQSTKSSAEQQSLNGKRFVFIEYEEFMPLPEGVGGTASRKSALRATAPLNFSNSNNMLIASQTLSSGSGGSSSNKVIRQQDVSDSQRAMRPLSGKSAPRVIKYTTNDASSGAILLPKRSTQARRTEELPGTLNFESSYGSSNNNNNNGPQQKCTASRQRPALLQHFDEALNFDSFSELLSKKELFVGSAKHATTSARGLRAHLAKNRFNSSENIDRNALRSAQKFAAAQERTIQAEEGDIKQQQMRTIAHQHALLEERESENLRLREKCETQSDLILRLEQKLFRLEQDVTGTTQRYEQQFLLAQRLSEEKEGLLYSREKLREMLTQREQALAELRRELAENNTDLQEQNSLLQQRLQYVQMLQTNAEQTAREREGKLQNLYSKLQDLTIQFSNSQKEVQLVRRENDSLRDELAQLRAIQEKVVQPVVVISSGGGAVSGKQRVRSVTGTTHDSASAAAAATHQQQTASAAIPPNNNSNVSQQKQYSLARSFEFASTNASSTFKSSSNNTSIAQKSSVSSYESESESSIQKMQHKLQQVKNLNHLIEMQQREVQYASAARSNSSSNAQNSTFCIEIPKDYGSVNLNATNHSLFNSTAGVTNYATHSNQLELSGKFRRRGGISDIVLSGSVKKNGKTIAQLSKGKTISAFTAAFNSKMLDC